jgi:alpha-beta hydrolase superfamily lysophospholipase
MRSSTSTFSAPDGATLHVYDWAPDGGGPVRGVVHVVHGMAEHAARYERLAEALTAVGFVVYAHDHRGHGRTASEGDLGHYGAGGWQSLVTDLKALLEREASAYPGLPVVLFGHSMGSFVVQEAVADISDRLAAVVLSGSSGKPTPLASAGRLVARAERARKGPRATSAILDGLSTDAFNKQFRPNRTAFDWLSRDEAEVDAYARDPLCGFSCTTDTWVELLDGVAHMSSPLRQARIRPDLPVYVFAGSEDPVSERTKGLRQLLGAYAKAGLRDVTHRFYQGARHETLNETNRDEVTKDLLGWLDEKLPLPAGG